MRRLYCAVAAGFLLFTAALLAQQDIQRGKIKKVDADKGTIVITVADKDRAITVRKDTRFMDESGQAIKDGLADKRLKAGAAVMFKAVRKDGEDVLIGMKLGGAPNQQPPPKVDLSGIKPLIELGTGQYQGFPGGLYPDGKNERPAAHEAAGLALAKTVQPLNEDGKPDKDGKIVLLSVGMSNTTQEFSMFQQIAKQDEDKNPRLVLVDGAQGGMTAFAIQDLQKAPGKRFWDTVDARLKSAGVSRAQVQIAWLKEADAGPNEGFPKYAHKLQEELGNVVRLMHERFPNLKMVYLSSRIFGGHAKTRLNPEPYAYESGFSVKWLIEQQIKGEPSLNFDSAKGEVKAPWLSWGPYLWAKGKEKNPDGLMYEESDFANDGTHPSMTGRRKVAEQLLRFFKTDSTAKPWFLAH
jgi:hypothetical protein